MKLWLWRHAAVCLPSGLCYGASDVAADEVLTLAAAQRAAQVLPVGVPVWVSGLGRAQQLARHLQALRPDLPVAQVDTRLNEMDFGVWELQPWAAIGPSAFDAWLADFAHHRFGGRESTQQVIDRVAAALVDFQAQYVAATAGVWITHAGVIRAAQYLQAHGTAPIAHAQQWPQHAPAPGDYWCWSAMRAGSAQ